MTITKKQYIEAKNTVRDYEKQLRISSVTHRLLPELKALAKKNRHISISDFIKSQTNTWDKVDTLREAFEDLLKEMNNEEITYERTSEIFITKGTKRGENELRYFPKHNGYLISHLVFRNGG